MGWTDDPGWAAAGHRVGAMVRAALGPEEHAILAIADADLDYVQVHGHLDLGWYLEARSGECDEPPISEVQRRRLEELGWRSPREHPNRPDPGNYWMRQDGEVEVYPLVLHMLATLAEVYGSSPEDLEPIRNGCECFEWVEDEAEDEDDAFLL